MYCAYRSYSRRDTHRSLIEISYGNITKIVNIEIILFIKNAARDGRLIKVLDEEEV